MWEDRVSWSDEASIERGDARQKFGYFATHMRNSTKIALEERKQWENLPDDVGMLQMGGTWGFEGGLSARSYIRVLDGFS